MSKVGGFLMVVVGLSVEGYYLTGADDREQLLVRATQIATTGETGPKSAATGTALPSASTATNRIAAAAARLSPYPLAADPRMEVRQVPVGATRAPTVEPAAAPPSDPGLARAQIAREIQHELKRVGCYDGVEDGDWGPMTRGAMATFVRDVNASLPTADPDYILLTLIKGHKGRACNGPAGTGEILALGTSDSDSDGKSSRTGPSGSTRWTTIVKTAPAVAAIEPARPRIAAATPDRRTVAAAQDPSTAATSANRGDAFAGRMTLGLPPPARLGAAPSDPSVPPPVHRQQFRVAAVDPEASPLGPAAGDEAGNAPAAGGAGPSAPRAVRPVPIPPVTIYRPSARPVRVLPPITAPSAPKVYTGGGGVGARWSKSFFANRELNTR